MNAHVTNLRPIIITLSSVATSTTALTYTQCPSVAAQAVVVSNPGTVAVYVGRSATPGNSIVVVGPGSNWTFNTLQNSNELYIANASGSSAQNIGLDILTYNQLY